jgi:hypothetical protein
MNDIHGDVEVDEVDVEVDVDSKTVIIERLRVAGFTWTDIASILEVDRKTIFRWRKEIGYDERPENAIIGIR